MHSLGSSAVQTSNVTPGESFNRWRWRDLLTCYYTNTTLYKRISTNFMAKFLRVTSRTNPEKMAFPKMRDPYVRGICDIMSTTMAYGICGGLSGIMLPCLLCIALVVLDCELFPRLGAILLHWCCYDSRLVP